MTVLITKLKLISFGQFENTTIFLDDGFNLLYGKNESGKSTIADFIEGVFYGFDDGVKQRHFNRKHEKYKPKYSYKYAGYIVLKKDGIDYRLSRNFYNGEYEIYDLSNDERLETKASNLNYPGEFFLGISYKLYQNLISNYQSQESPLAAKASIIEFLSTTDDYNFSSVKAIDYLDEKLSAIGTDRAFTKPYFKVKTEINELLEKTSALKVLRENTNKDFALLFKNRDKIANKTGKLKELRKDRDSYRGNLAYKNLEDEIKYRNKLNNIEQKLEEYEDFNDYEQESKDFKELFKNKYILFSLFIILVLLCLAIYKKEPYLIAIAIILFVLIIISFLKNNNLSDSSDKTYNNQRYSEYMALVKEKEKIIEVLRILENQDKTKDRANIDIIENIDIKAVEAKIKNLEIELEDLNKENLYLEKKLATAQEELEKEVDLLDRLEKLENDLASMEKEIEAIYLAKDTIKDLSQYSKADRISFNKEISKFISNITNGRYKEISYDSDFLPTIIKANGEGISLDKLSTGFYDQLNFALKYLINENKIDNFIVFDDAFINYDLERLRNALFFLLDLSSDRQIIYLTCHNREEELLKTEAIEFNMINLEDIWYMP